MTMSLVARLEQAVWRAACGLSLLLPLWAFGSAQFDWLQLGHFHAGSDGIVHHRHAHVGDHDHRADLTHRVGLPGGRPLTEPSRPGESPTDPASPDVYIASFLLLDLDPPAPLNLERPTSDVRPVVAYRALAPRGKDRRDAAAPRGPPSA